MKEQLRFRIILASEPEGFAQERKELGAFVESLNDKGRSLRYELVTEEALQEEDCGQSFYLLIGKEFPDEEKALFHKVYDSFCETGTPMMYTYFRRKQSDPLTKTVAAFMTELDEEIGHFFSTYEDLDSVKLGILLELVRSSGMKEVFSIQGGEVAFRGKRVLSLENLPLYKGNEGLQKLLKQKKELAAEYEEAAVAAAHDPENRDLQSRKEEISRRQKEVFEALRVQEKELRELLLEIAWLTGKGTQTATEKLAIRELETGNYENAEQILRRADRSLANRPVSMMLAADKKVLEGYVSENRLLIKTLMASGVTRERADEIRKCWEEILRLTKEYGLDPAQADGYDFFLIQIGEDTKALEVLSLTEKLVRIRGMQKKEEAEFLGTRGLVYEKLGLANEAENCMIQAVKMLRELAEKPDAGTESKAALLSACYNLGVFENTRFGKTEQAFRYLKEAEEGYLKLCEEDKVFWETRLSMVYGSQGDIYLKQRTKSSDKKAAERYQKTLEICERRAEEDLMGMGQQLAEAYQRLSAFYASQEKMREAYLMAENAWRTYDKLVRISPAFYRDGADQARSRMANTGIAEMQWNRKQVEKHLEEIDKLNQQASRPKIKVKEKRFLLVKAMKHCAELEQIGAKDPAMGNSYFLYGNTFSLDAAAEYYEKAWSVYGACFPRYPEYCLFKMTILLVRLWEPGEEKDHPERFLPYVKKMLDLIEEKGTEVFKPGTLCDAHGICGDIYHECRKLRDAELQYQLVEKYLLQQKEEKPASENIRRKLRENEYRLRHMYIKTEVRESYSEEELEELIADFSGAMKASKRFGKFVEREMKYKVTASMFMKTGDLNWKIHRDLEKADVRYQIAKVLYRQLADEFPGRYREELKAVGEKIEELHSHWKESEI